MKKKSNLEAMLEMAQEAIKYNCPFEKYIKSRVVFPATIKEFVLEAQKAAANGLPREHIEELVKDFVKGRNVTTQLILFNDIMEGRNV